MKLIYCDTCVYRDLFDWRKGTIPTIHYGEKAQALFDAVKRGEYQLLVSDYLEGQLKFQGFKSKYDRLLKKIKLEKNSLKIVEITCQQGDKDHANSTVSANPECEFEDAVHAELALRGNASILVTRDLGGYKFYNKDIKVRFPEHVGLF